MSMTLAIVASNMLQYDYSANKEILMEANILAGLQPASVFAIFV